MIIIKLATEQTINKMSRFFNLWSAHIVYEYERGYDTYKATIDDAVPVIVKYWNDTDQITLEMSETLTLSTKEVEVIIR